MESQDFYPPGETIIPGDDHAPLARDYVFRDIKAEASDVSKPTGLLPFVLRFDGMGAVS